MKRELTDYNFGLIANTINLNLSYLNSVSSSVNILESSLQYPMLECMERRIKFKNVELEYNHPTFNQKRCDLFWVDKEDNKFLLEMKYIKQGNPDEVLILTDIIRQYFAHKEGYYTYFLLCSRHTEQTRQNSLLSEVEISEAEVTLETILNATISTNGQSKIHNYSYNNWLSSDVENKEVCFTIDLSHKAYKDITTKYDFNNPRQSFPNEISLKTRLVVLTQQTGNSPLTHQVGIWEILNTNE